MTSTATSASSPGADEGAAHKDPWPALFALCLGFFMILVDSTIVSVATPTLIDDLHTEVNNVVWVTSAYLLAYAVPVLITGRLGDRFGPKRLYLVREATGATLLGAHHERGGVATRVVGRRVGGPSGVRWGNCRAAGHGPSPETGLVSP